MNSIITNGLSLLSGFIIANGTPHLINGISGRYWPRKSRLTNKVEKAYQQKSATSSPVANIIWGTLNATIAFLILHFIRGNSVDGSLNLITFLIGLIGGALYISWNFTDKDSP